MVSGGVLGPDLGTHAQERLTPVVHPVMFPIKVGLMISIHQPKRYCKENNLTLAAKNTAVITIVNKRDVDITAGYIPESLPAAPTEDVWHIHSLVRSLLGMNNSRRVARSSPRKIGTCAWAIKLLRATETWEWYASRGTGTTATVGGLKTDCMIL